MANPPLQTPESAQAVNAGLACRECGHAWSDHAESCIPFDLASAKQDAINLVDELIYAVDYRAEPSDELRAIYRLIREARERLEKVTAADA